LFINDEFGNFTSSIERCYAKRMPFSVLTAVILTQSSRACWFAPSHFAFFFLFHYQLTLSLGNDKSAEAHWRLLSSTLQELRATVDHQRANLECCNRVVVLNRLFSAPSHQ
jgi:hypothetical protein